MIKEQKEQLKGAEAGNNRAIACSIMMQKLLMGNFDEGLERNGLPGCRTGTQETNNCWPITGL